MSWKLETGSPSPFANPKPANRSLWKRGFTLTELVALSCVSCVLTLFLVPLLGGTRSNGRMVQCLQNMKQLAQAWEMYAEDHRGKLVPNFQGGAAQGGNFPPAIGPGWAAGWLDWSTSPDNTNT